VDLTDKTIGEDAVLLGRSKSLVGIVNMPPVGPRSQKRPGVILLNSGIIHRVGPNRLYVKLARRLAQTGAVVLRFDLSSIGDSMVRADNLPFSKSAVQETIDAMDYLTDTYGLDHFVLIGICTGAVVSYDTALVDERVVGALLINAQGYIPESEVETQGYIADGKNVRYYLGSAVHNPASWLKLLTGQADYRNILRAVRRRLLGTAGSSAAKNPETERVAEGFRVLLDKGTELFSLYSEGDPGIDELNLILGSELHFLQRGSILAGRW
jgi:pimeloyl-ACP methyl ester carboxylesterase